MTLLPPGVRSTWPSLHRHAQGHRRRCRAGPRRAAAGSLFWAPLFVPAVGRPLAPLWSNLGISACERHVRSTFDTVAKVAVTFSDPT
jgi:hypothetical protein